jgi:hypothetical protein
MMLCGRGSEAATTAVLSMLLVHARDTTPVADKLFTVLAAKMHASTKRAEASCQQHLGLECCADRAAVGD